MESLDQYLNRQDNADAKEEAIQFLAEQLTAASVSAVGQVGRASNYEFSYKLMINLTNGSDEFNEMFYKIAEKLIDSVG